MGVLLMQVRTGVGMLLRALPGSRPFTAAVLRRPAETPAARLAALTGDTPLVGILTPAFHVAPCATSMNASSGRS